MDLEGYKWVNISEATKDFYWEEFQVHMLLLTFYLVIRHDFVMMTNGCWLL